MTLRVNGKLLPIDGYMNFHAGRFDKTLDLVRRYGGGSVVEVGGVPWAMTSRLAAEPGVDLRATVSEEAGSNWSDELPVTRKDYELQIGDAAPRGYVNYSANVERTLFPIDEPVDMVLACEIIEHLTRAPHTMLLNINGWLKPGGIVIITTPNGSQLENPFRVKAKMPAYRPCVYSRHNYVFTLDGLADLVETCGFEILEASHWSPYTRSGLSNLYRPVVNLGSRYLKDKFAQTVCVVGRKIEHRQTASRLPRCFARQSGWERIDGADQIVDPWSLDMD